MVGKKIDWTRAGTFNALNFFHYPGSKVFLQHPQKSSKKQGCPKTVTF